MQFSAGPTKMQEFVQQVLYFTLFPSSFFFLFFFIFIFLIIPSPKAKSRQPWSPGGIVCSMDAGRLADAGRSSTVPLTFFQGLAVPLQCFGCTQPPVYSRIPKSGFVFSCLLLQSVPGSVGDSSCWSFTGLEREGFGFFRVFLCPPCKHWFCFIPFLEWNFCLCFCLKDAEELSSIFWSQD